MEEKVYRRIIDHYGIENQRKKAIEELMELIAELNKKKIDKDKLLDEVADVFNMINQIIQIYSIDFMSVIQRMEFKNKRELERIDKSKKRSVLL